MYRCNRIAFAILLPLLLAMAVAMTLAACRGDSANSETASAPAAQAGATAAAAQPTLPPRSQLTPTPTPAPTPTATPAPPTPTPTPAPAPTPTQPAAQWPSELVQYAAQHAGGPGAIYAGDATALVGLPPDERLMFYVPETQYLQATAAATFGVPLTGIPGHAFIYKSDYYRDLLDQANLINPTKLTSRGHSINIRHVCIDRNLPSCVLVESYFAPNVAERTDGQIRITVAGFAELGLAGPETLNQVSDGDLDLVNIYAGYVADEFPDLEIMSLWGIFDDWETSYLALTGLAPDIDRRLAEYSGGGRVVNRNWFAGADQWFFTHDPLRTLPDFEDSKIHAHGAAMSDFIRGMGATPARLPAGGLRAALQTGAADAAAATMLQGITQLLHLESHYAAGPVIGFGYTHNVISRDLWNTMPADLRQIMLEEGARAELEALRLAPFQNLMSRQAHQVIGLESLPFSDDIKDHVKSVVLPEYVLPGWVSRLGYPDAGAAAVDLYNAKVAPYTGLAIAPDGSIERIPITQGPDSQVEDAPKSDRRHNEMSEVETKLAALGYRLPPPPDPVGNYLPITRSGNVMWLAGVGSRLATGEAIAGKLGADLTVAQGYEAAKWSALNLLARMQAELGDLDRVTRILKVVGMVNSAPTFTQQAAVVDGASDLFVALYGDRGRHSRSAPGMAALPGNTAVICDCVIEVDGG